MAGPGPPEIETGAAQHEHRHAEEDRRLRDEQETRNTADTLVYQTRKLLKDQGDKISGPEKDAVEAALTELESALKKFESGR